MFRLIKTQRLILKPFSKSDFDQFVEEMLTDPKVVQFYYSYQELNTIKEVRVKALKDFWEHFEESRNDYGLEIWSGKRTDDPDGFVGWCGLLHTELTIKYGGPELQYMLAGGTHGNGYATEMAKAVLENIQKMKGINKIIATVDIPNIASIRVLEKLQFELVDQIDAYGSSEMYLYQKFLK